MKQQPVPRYESSPKRIRDRLWWLVIGPSLWALHFLACYLTAAIWCEKYAASASSNAPLQNLVAVYSLVAVLGIGLFGWLSYRSHRRGAEPMPRDQDRPRDRSRFIGFAAFLLSLLSLVATLYTGLVFVLIRSCD